MDTSTIPIISGEAPNAEAMLTECSTAVSLEKTKRTNPPIRTRIGTRIATITSKTMLSHASEIKAVVNEIKHYELLFIISQALLRAQ
jgi:hypothetical protein